MTVNTKKRLRRGGGRRYVRRVGGIRFLNTVPLIDGLSDDDAAVVFDVPSRMLDYLLTGAVDAALCPVIDYQRSPVPLRIIPVGGIGCRGPTLTVRLFSRMPVESIRRVHVDGDSHTSVALLQVLLAERWDVRPELTPWLAGRSPDDVEAALLIGDKVVAGSLPEDRFPCQLDLGQAWFEHTDLPFVFAVWMCRDGADVGNLPLKLDAVRRANESQLARLADKHAASHGWPTSLARTYLARMLRYEIGQPQLQAMRRFFESAHRLGLIEHVRPVISVSDGDLRETESE